MTSIRYLQNVTPVNDADKSGWPTIGCRVRPSDLFFIDRAVVDVKYAKRCTTYKRSDFIAEAVIEKAMAVFGEDAEAIRADPTRARGAHRA